MKLWTIQDIEAYKEFRNIGILEANKGYIFEEWLFQYNWMKEQMIKRIGNPLYNDIEYPIWAWYQWNGKSQKRPDLRFSGHLNKGTKGVLLELEIDSKDVLLSDFKDFNNILNWSYMSDNEKEYDNFYKELESYGYNYWDLQDFNKKSESLNKFRERLFKSWEKIFDLDRNRDESWSGKKEDMSIQATMWQVKWKQVISIKEFIAR